MTWEYVRGSTTVCFDVLTTRMLLDTVSDTADAQKPMAAELTTLHDRLSLSV